jgi:hypothetical protein
MEFREILIELKKPFKPEEHEDRPLPGGGKWFYVTWQNVRERLDKVYPEWECWYSEPSYIGDHCHISCKITICGISRQCPGNAPIILTSKEGKDMARGSPIERATADAFKNAAEAFGVARYLDDQKLTVSLMHKQGDYRAYAYAKENEQIEAGARGVSKISQPVKVITEPQVKRFWAIAKTNNVTDDEIGKILDKFSVTSAKDIPMGKYDLIIKELEAVVSF